ncbi:bifunctional glutamate N-acetyltransferase/amino-acid acetyltransferase ArgJ [bacterium]|nr:bifunctional glutamate N-acetyltransferase/amino-acid acetyltransferase ArgJ [bacterium]
MKNILGFKFSGINCGLKKSKKKDLGLIMSSEKCISHAVFTKNKILAAPLIVSKKTIKNNGIYGVIVNSGNANACTGTKGIRAVEKTISKAADFTNLKKNNFFVSSTGIIGIQLDVNKITNNFDRLFNNLHVKNIKDFAEAIMTTDKYYKIKKSEISIGTKKGSIIGIAKGAGMIHPNMATMLCYLLTDIKFDTKTFKNFINRAVDSTFNCISVDGEMSTNDTVLGLSNGLLGNKKINDKSPQANKIYKSIENIFYGLSKDIVLDGEGSTKICKIIVKGAKNSRDSKRIARNIANSLLFKTALFGSDPNWGRIISAVGSTQIKYIDQNSIDIYIGDKLVVKNGLGLKLSKKINQIMRKKEIKIIIDLKKGKYESFMLTNDIGHEYIKINSLYTT